MNKIILLKSRSLGDLKPKDLLLLLAVFLITVVFTGAFSQESNASHEEFASCILIK